ncbi:MAG: helix-turn-helix transcriptional regulator [Gemmatimonadaceae bacterium]
MSNRRDRDDAEPTSHRTPDEERQADAIFRLACDWAFNELLPDDPRNVPFFEWLTKDARERQTLGERADTDRLASEFAERMRKRWQTEVIGVEEAPAVPPREAAPVETSTAHALELAGAARRAPYVDLAVAAGEGRELWDEVCTEWVELPPGLPPARYLALRVSGDSMTPLLHGGDTILVRIGERNERLEPGRVVVARRPDNGYVVKRLGDVATREIELLSLNPDFPSIRIPRRPGAVLGTVVLRWCAQGARRA